MAEVARPRMLFAGAGAAIQFPLNHSRSPVSSSSSSAVAAASSPVSIETQNAYLVTPAAHIGRVVTGVVFVAQQTRLLNREFTQSTASQNGSIVEEFGLATISFADKLAEQGYKVLVLNVFSEKAKAHSSDVVDEQMRIVEQAVLFLKQKQDIQRVALCGFGPGADLAIKMSIERPVLLDCSIMMCPNGSLAWTKPESAPAPAPMLLLVGDKNPYSRSQAVRVCLSRCVDLVDVVLKLSFCAVPATHRHIRGGHQHGGVVLDPAKPRIPKPGQGVCIFLHHRRRCRHAGHRGNPRLARHSPAPLPRCGRHE